MYFKGIIITLLCFLFSSSLLYGQDQQKCSDALIELIETNEVSREQLQKFLKLQADLTLHKLAYSLYRNTFEADRFKIEKEILALLNQMDNPNPEFQEIKQKFEGNKLSRTRLAQVMPYLKNIVNEQLEETDPFKRKNFLIGSSDIKMLAVLAGSEFKYDSGRYINRYVSNHDSFASVFNMLRIINEAVEKNQNKTVDIRKSISNRLQDIQTEMVNFLDKFKMPSECQALYSSCRIEHGDQAIIDEDFVALMLEVGNQAQGFHRTRYLRYGEIDLVVDQDERKTKLIKKTSKPSTDKPIASAENKKSNEEIVQDYLIQHVLDHIPYFTTREELAADPELLYALAKAIDAGVHLEKEQGKRLFYYKGDIYYLPELWNKGYSGNRLEQFVNKKVKNVAGWLEDLITDDSDFKIPEEIPENLKDDFETVRNEQFFIFNRYISFEFRGKLYDINTGKLIPPTKQGLLSYKKGVIPNGAGNENLVDPSLNARKAQAIKAGEKSYIVDDEVFHISDQQVNVDLEYDRFKAAMNNQTSVSVNSAATKKVVPTKQSILDLEQVEPEKYALVIKAITDKKRSLTYDGQVYDLLSEKPFVPLTIKQQSEIVANFAKNSGISSRSKASSENVSAILNDRTTYEQDGAYYNTLTGRKIASKNEVIEIEKGFYEHDQIFSNELELNEQDNETILKQYFKSSNAKSCDYHSVVDKKNSLLKVYNQAGKIVYQTEIILGKVGDSLKASHTPAGILYTDIGDGLVQSYLPHIDMQSIDSSFIEQMVALNNGNMMDNRITNGGIFLATDKIDKYRESFHDNQCPLYVLPDSDDLKFQLRDGKLEFKAVDQRNYAYDCSGNKKKCIKDYNFTDNDEFAAHDIMINFEDIALENNTSRAFADSLVSNKADLMKKLGLSNGEYNELAKMAIAILGVESGFGTEKAYKIKESKLPVFAPVGTPGMPPVYLGTANTGQALVNSAKYIESLEWGDQFFFKWAGKLFDMKDYQNSRGLTQIKDVRGFLKKEYPEITEESLNNPKHAAIATMFVLSQKYKQLEYVKKAHPAITETNKFDYLYYIYSGSAHRIGTKNATPQLNTKSKELIAYASKIKVLTK